MSDKNELAKVYHFDLYGKREEKYEFLNENSLESIQWNELATEEPNYFFVKKNFEGSGEYEEYIELRSLFINNSIGIVTGDDNELVSFDKSDILQKFDSTCTFYYRPFDNRFTVFDNQILRRARYNTMRQYIKPNIGLNLVRQSKLKGPELLASKNIVCKHLITGESYNFPLYLYPDNTGQHSTEQSTEQSTEREPNLNMEIVSKIADGLGLAFVKEKYSPPLEGWQAKPDGVVVSESDGVTTNEPLTTINGKAIYRNYVDNLPYNTALKQLAKDKRKGGILSEVLFWQQIHKGMFHNIDFDRQRIIGNFIVDFYVKTLGLIIEIDGSSHNDKIEYDEQRQLYLESLGLKIYRISDLDVKHNLSNVLLGLEEFIISEFGETTTPPDCVRHPSKGGEFAPIDILDYIYAVLHSPTYREKYKEFLKIDFPRVPYPKDQSTFWQLVKLGGELRQIHLLESAVVDKPITQYPVDGDNVVTKISFSFPAGEGRDGVPDTIGNVHINDTQYFANVPEVAWNFYIGGYQPAQKWLKDRKGRVLSYEDIFHYQKIVVALTETDRIMKEIDGIEVE